MVGGCKKKYLGIDLGGTNIAAGVVSDAYEVVGRKSVPTPKGGTGETLSDIMAQLVRNLLAEQGLTLADIPWVGIGAPGYIDSALGINHFAGNLCGGLREDPMAAILECRLGIKAYLCNDADAAAYGESVAGAAKGAARSMTITLGTGVGGGIILEGSGSFLVGEVGHTVICQGGEDCSCGHKGCWEAYASATALIRQTKRAMEVSSQSALWQVAGSLDGVNGKTAFDAKDLGDPVAAAVVDTYISYVACGLANLMNILEPQVVCIAGGISAQGEKLLAPLREKVRREVFTPLVADKARIVRAALGDDAGIIGAALLGKYLAG